MNTLRFVFSAALLVFGAIVAEAQTKSFTVESVNSTAAVLRIKGGPSGTCTITATVKLEFPDIASFPIADTNTTLFPGSNACNRDQAWDTNGETQFVLGGERKLSVSSASGFLGKHVRTLFPDATYTITLFDGTTNYIRTFHTSTTPDGASRNFHTVTDIPDIKNERGHIFPDPDTGMPILVMDIPGDSHVAPNGQIYTPVVGASYTTPNEIITDDASHASTTTNNAKLVIPFSHPGALFSQPHMGKEGTIGTLSALKFEAKVLFSSCPTTANCEVSYCLTRFGVTCAEDMKTNTFTGTTSAAYYPLGDTVYMPYNLNAWADPATTVGAGKYSSFHALPRIGVSGTASGNTISKTAAAPYFDVTWPSGTRLYIGSTLYTIQSVESPTSLTVSPTPPAGAVTFDIHPVSLMLWPSNLTGGQTFTVQHVRLTGGDNGVYLSSAPAFEYGGDASVFTAEGLPEGCSRLLNLSGRVMVFNHCTSTTTPIGSAYVPGDGLTRGQATLSSVQFDQSDPRSMIAVAGSEPSGDNVFIKLTWVGTWPPPAAPALHGDYPLSPICGTTNCWQISVVSPIGLRARLLASPNVNVQRCGSSTVFPSFTPFGIIPGTTHFVFRPTPQQDYVACHVVYDYTTGALIGAKNHWPNLIHSDGLAGPNVVRTDQKPGGSAEFSLGGGPGRAFLTSAVSTTMSLCPDRPGGSPIPAEEWPTGLTQCRTVTLDGHFADPSPTAEETTLYGQCGATDCGASRQTEVKGREIGPGEHIVIFGSSKPYTACMNDVAEIPCDTMRILTMSPDKRTLVVHGGRNRNTNEPYDAARVKSHASGDIAMVWPTCSRAQVDGENSAAYQLWQYTIDTVGDAQSLNDCMFLHNGHSHMTFNPNATGDGISHGSVTMDKPVWFSSGKEYLFQSGHTASNMAPIPFSNAVQTERWFASSYFPGGAVTFNDGTNSAESHPSGNLKNPKRVTYDQRTLQTVGNLNPATLVTGNLWKYTDVSMANPKLLTFFCAVYFKLPCNNISSPAQGNIIGTTLANERDVCWARVANECRTGSSPNDVYIVMRGPSTNTGCGYGGVTSSRRDNYVPCLGMSTIHRTIVQYNHTKLYPDWHGSTFRRLSGGIGTPTTFATVRPISITQDREAIIWLANDINNGPSRAFMGFPPKLDMSLRNRVSPVFYDQLLGPGSSPAYIEWKHYSGANTCDFNYNDTCRTTITATQSNPYKWSTEWVSGTDAMPCTTGCIIRVPFESGTWQMRVVRNGIAGPWRFIAVE